MSACGRTHLVEAVVHGELSASLEHELRSHARSCALCRHELNWLETERRLFRQRAGRDEVARLWKGVARRTGQMPPPRWPGALAALAASVLLLVGVNGLPRGEPSELFEAGRTLQSEQLWSAPLSASPDSRPACSGRPSGPGFHCGPAVPASFFASR